MSRGGRKITFEEAFGNRGGVRPGVQSLGLRGAFNLGAETANNPNTNPFISGVVPFIPLEETIPEEVRNSPEYLVMRRVIDDNVRIINEVFQERYTTRQLLPMSRVPGGVTYMPSRLYYAEEERIQVFLNRRREAEEGIRRLVGMMVNLIGEGDIIPLEFDQMVYFILWRMSEGDRLIAEDTNTPLTFPYQRGPQEVQVEYYNAVLSDEERQNIDRVDYTNILLFTRDELISKRGVDYFGHTMVRSLANGCVDHFYDVILERLKAALIERGYAIGSMTERAGYVGLRDLLNVPRDVFAEVVRAVYQIRDENNQDTAYLLGLRLREFFAHILTGRYTNIEAFTKNLTAIYVESRKYGITMSPLYERRSKDMAVCGLGFIAKYLYRGNNPIITAAQNRAISARNQLKNVYNFTQRAKRQACKLLCVVENSNYDDTEGNSIIYVRSNPNIMNVLVGARFGYIINNNMRQYGERGMAVGALTSQLRYTEEVNGIRYQNYRKYYGHNVYEIGYSDEQKEQWMDNSNSANLCVITSMIYNNTLKPIIEAHMSMEEFIGQVTLASNMYIDKRLIKSNQMQMMFIHRVILNWIAKKLAENNDDKEYIYVRYYVKKKCNIYEYRCRDGFYGCTKAEELELKREQARIISIYTYEDHMFNVVDGELERNSQHLAYLRNWFRDPSRLVVRNSEVECLFNDIRVYQYTKLLLSEKWRLINTRDFWYRKINVRSVFLPSNLIYAAAEQIFDSYDKDNDNSNTDDNDEYNPVRELKQLIGLNIEDKEIISLYYQSANEPYYVAYDFETVLQNKKAVAYGYGLAKLKSHSSSSLTQVEISTNHILDIGVNKRNECLMILSMLAEVCRPVIEEAEAEARAKATEKDIPIETVDRYYRSVKMFAHNGGRFDTVLTRNILCEDILKVCSKRNIESEHISGLRFVPASDIEGGGRLKMFTIKVYDEHNAYLFDIVMVDSLCLLGCALEDVAKEYGLPKEIATKGDYPYAFYDYVVENNLKLRWHREELLRWHYPEHVRTPLYAFLAKYQGDVIDMVELFKEYCGQDVNILMRGVVAAHRLYHAIDVTNIKEKRRDAEGKEIYENVGVIKPGDILRDDRGIVYSIKSNGERKRTRVRFIDNVTLPGFAKKIAKYSVLGDNVMTTNSIMNEYLSVWTGGQTYCREVAKFVSSKMRDIAVNPYFYIDRAQRDLIELFRRYGYDENKVKRTYKLNRAEPLEVYRLKQALTDLNASILLVDYNSLYPSAIAKIKAIGGFPVGEESVITRGQEELDELLVNNKRWIGHFRVVFTEEAKKKYREDKVKPMHQLIIRTKTGNRHLRPTDQECNSYGMTDIMYRSIQETNTGLFNLEFLSGVYWNEGSNRFSDLMEILYAERNRWKALESPVETRVKLVMNSMYGILLEKCHYIKSEYLDARDDKEKDKYDDVYNMDLGMVEQILRPGEFKVSELQSHKYKYEPIAEYDLVGEYTRAETIEMKELRLYESLGHYGSFILDMSKREMNLIFHKLGWNVRYTDTDSVFITNDQYQRLVSEDEGKEVKFMGRELGQFKSDFDGKWRQAKVFVPEGIISVASVFLAKKCYCNVLLGLISDNNEDYCISVKLKTAGKGVLHEALNYLDYERLIDPAKALKQDRAGLVGKGLFILDGGVKSNGGIHITNKDDPNRRRICRTIRNQDAIEAEYNRLRLKKRGEGTRLIVEAPKVEVKEQGNEVKLQIFRSIPTMTMNIIRE